MSVAARARRQRAPPFLDPPGYARHRPAATLLYQLVEQHHPAFRALRSEAGRPLPGYIEQEFDAYLKCGRLEEGFLRLRCNACHAEKLVAFSCKKRGFRPSCGARRMTETAALLAEGVLPERPLRQWVLSLPHALRFLLAGDPEALTLVLAVMYRTISRHLIDQVGLTRATGATGGVAPPARRYTLKTPYRDGTTHIVLEPLDLMAWLAALVPPPRHVAMTWTRRLKRVFGIEIDRCARCGGKLKIVAGIEEPEVIAKILWHLQRTTPEKYRSEPAARKRLPLVCTRPPKSKSGPGCQPMSTSENMPNWKSGMAMLWTSRCSRVSPRLPVRAVTPMT